MPQSRIVHTYFLFCNYTQTQISRLKMFNSTPPPNTAIRESVIKNVTRRLPRNVCVCVCVCVRCTRMCNQRVSRTHLRSITYVVVGISLVFFKYRYNNGNETPLIHYYGWFGSVCMWCDFVVKVVVVHTHTYI